MEKVEPDNIVDVVIADRQAKNDGKQEPEPVYHIKGGLVEKGDGELTRTKMFDILEVPLDDYSDLTFTQAEVRRMRMHAMKMRTGIQAMVPIMCLGPMKCPFKKRCPIVDRSMMTKDGEIDFKSQDITKFPIMRQCPIEVDFLSWARASYVQEFEVDIESYTELGLVNKLAELDLYEYRLNLLLAHGDMDGDGPTLLKKQVTAISMTNVPIEKLEEHPAWGLKDKIHKQRMEILSALVGTRKEKYKKEAALKKTEDKDPSTVQAELRAKLNQLEKQFNEENIIDGEYTEPTKK